MAITRFRYEDSFHGWMLDEVSFSSVNLLVGTSGVGKTRILEAIQSVHGAGVSDARRANGCKWTLELESEGVKFSWMAETSIVDRYLPLDLDEDEEGQDTETPGFLRERIMSGKKMIVDRSEGEFIFNGTPLPKLKNSESAITLLSDEESIAPINRALHSIVFSEGVAEAYAVGDTHDLSLIRKDGRTLDGLREATGFTLEKAYILQEDYPDEFQRIKEDYLEIFDTVSDVKIGRLRELDPSVEDYEPSAGIEWLGIGLKEHGVKGWITNY